MPKNKIKLLFMAFLLLLMAKETYATITCGTGSGSSNTADFSIRSGSGSLSSMHVQDQDGLGTCYANALSLALEANLGAPVSYQQLAVLYGANKNATGGNAVSERNEDGSLKTNFMEGGFACDTFNIIKARNPNYLCARESVPLENLASPGGQSQVMNAMAEYYDRFNQFKVSNPEEARLFSANLRSIFTHEQTSSTEHCNHIMSDNATGSGRASALEDQLSNYCLSQYDSLKSYQEAERQLTQRLSAIPSDEAHEMDRLEVEGLRAHARDEIRIAKHKIESIGEISEDANLDGVLDTPTDPGVMTIFSCFVKSSVTQKISAQYLPQMAKAFRDGDGQRSNASFMGTTQNPGPLRNFINTPGLFPAIANSTEYPDEIFYNTSRSFMNERELEDKLKNDIYNAVPSLCRRNQAWVNMSNSSTFTEAYHHARGMCLNSNLGNAVADLFGSLGVLTQGSLPSDAVIQALTRTDKPLEEYFLGTVSPECLEDRPGVTNPHRLQIPPSMSCNKLEFPADIAAHADVSILRRRLGRTPPASARGLLIINQFKREEGARQLRALADAQLHSGNGNPVMLDFCTAFFRDNTADSDFGTNCDVGTQKHGFHALNLIGHRCRAGKIEYQLQNSWGQGCGSYVRPPAGGTAIIDPTTQQSATGTPQYECDSANGNVWVPEDILVRNMRGAQYLSR